MAKTRGPGPGEYYDKNVQKQLELENITEHARLRLLRLVRQWTDPGPYDEEGTLKTARTLIALNIASSTMGGEIFNPEPFDDGFYHHLDVAYAVNQLERIFRRPDSPIIFDVIADLIEGGCLRLADVNEILESDGVGVYYEYDGLIQLNTYEKNNAPESLISDNEHENIRYLFDRMERQLLDEDWSAVVHTAASAIETLAKTVVESDNIQSQSLGSWFDLYRKKTSLPDDMIESAHEIFKRRNEAPLAGHGSKEVQAVTEREARITFEKVRTIVRLERSLSRSDVS